MANLTDSFHLDLEKIIEKIPNVSLDYDTEKKEITLKDWETILSTIDATDFIKDGMVDSVELDENILKIVFNTDADKEEIDIDLTDFIKPYEAGDNIEITDSEDEKSKIISVKDVLRQFEELPEEPVVGDIVEYTGADTADLTHGRIYEFKEIRETTGEAFRNSEDSVWLVKGSNLYNLNGSVLTQYSEAVADGDFATANSIVNNETPWNMFMPAVVWEAVNGELHIYEDDTKAVEVSNGTAEKALDLKSETTTQGWEEVLMFTPEEAKEAILSETFTGNVEVGGVVPNTTFEEGMLLEDILKEILIKYFAPEVKITAPTASVYLNGETASLGNVVASVTQKSIKPTSVKFYKDGTLINTQNFTASGSYTTEVDDITTTTEFKVVAEDGKDNGEAKVKIQFVDGNYFGTIDDAIGMPDAEVVKGLNRMALTGKGYTNSNIEMVYGRIVYAIPAEYGNITHIKDSNNVDYINSYTKSVLDIDGVSYNVYTLTDSAGVSKFTQIYS